MTDFTFQSYDNLEITTQTWVVYTNLQIKNQILFDAVECKTLTYPISRAQQRMFVNPMEETLCDGDILFAEYLGSFKGQHFRKQKGNQMRNCATLIMKIAEKYYNIKVSKKGNLQITGCRSEYPVRKIVEHVWKILQHVPGSYSFQESFKSNNFVGYASCRMHNVRFILPCGINLQNMNNTIKVHVGVFEPSNEDVEYSSTYEPSVSVSINVKINSSIEKIEDIPVTKFIGVNDGTVEFTTGYFREYLSTLSPKEKMKKMSKGYQNSFFVFPSGCTVMSGKISETNRRDSYQKFCSMIQTYGHYFCIDK